MSASDSMSIEVKYKISSVDMGVSVKCVKFINGLQVRKVLISYNDFISAMEVEDIPSVRDMEKWLSTDDGVKLFESGEIIDD